MGTRGRDNLNDSKLFFVTTTLKRHERLFATATIRNEAASMLFRVARANQTTLMAYCMMPSHIHLIAGHPDGGSGISRFLQSYKSLVSHILFRERHGVWTPRFDDVVIASESLFLAKLNYIHENPVRAGLAIRATDWRWSSARFWYLDEPSDALSKSFGEDEPAGGARRGRLAGTQY
ncbi:MAG TPA: transposase [candidate division Zixibacteria bacterium]|jgi:putative transposase